jgi:APA family basic amino acid/polyamine antiporter
LSHLFRRKVGEPATPTSYASLRRTLGVWQLTALGVGATVGAGIFSGSGSAIAGGANLLGAGPALVISHMPAAIVACGGYRRSVLRGGEAAPPGEAIG